MAEIQTGNSAFVAFRNAAWKAVMNQMLVALNMNNSVQQ